MVRGLLVLAAFSSGDPGRRVIEVADELMIANAAVHRYVSALVELGLLEQDPATRRYRRVLT
jgi:DNA-binding IclR family transcriptional regulator